MLPVDLAAPDDVLALADARSGRPDRRRARGAARARASPTCFAAAGRPIVGPVAARRGARVLEGLREGLHGAARDSDRAVRGLRRSPSRRSTPCPAPSSAFRSWSKPTASRRARASSSPAIARRRRRPSARRWSTGSSARPGARLVIEECLTGPEVSFFFLCDGTRAVPLGSAQDHKRIFDDDRGPNTGGMGAFAPSPLATPQLDARRHAARSSQPVLDGHARGRRAVHRVSLRQPDAHADGPKVIEFNVRFGDPKRRSCCRCSKGRSRDVLLGRGRRLAGRRRRLRRRTNARRRRAGVARVSGQRRDRPGRSTGLDAAAAMPGVARVSRGTRARRAAQSSRPAAAC